MFCLSGCVCQKLNSFLSVVIFLGRSTKFYRFFQPSHIPARKALARLSDQIADSWHFSMVNDHSRNSAFIGALKNYLRRNIGSVSTLDLGSGTGLLGIAADNFGSIKTTCCEFNSPLGKNDRDFWLFKVSSVFCNSVFSHELDTPDLIYAFCHLQCVVQIRQPIFRKRGQIRQICPVYAELTRFSPFIF